MYTSKNRRWRSSRKKPTLPVSFCKKSKMRSFLAANANKKSLWIAVKKWKMIIKHWKIIVGPKGEKILPLIIQKFEAKEMQEIPSNQENEKKNMQSTSVTKDEKVRESNA